MSKDKWPDTVEVSKHWIWIVCVGLSAATFYVVSIRGPFCFRLMIGLGFGVICSLVPGVILQTWCDTGDIKAPRGSLLWIVVVVLPWATLGCTRYVLEVACKAVLWACTATPAMGRGKKADPQARGMAEAIQAALKARTRKEANDILRKAVSKGN